MFFVNNTWRFRTTEYGTVLVMKDTGSTFNARSRCLKNFTLSSEENDGFGGWKKDSYFTPFKQKLFLNGKSSIEVIAEGILW